MHTETEGQFTFIEREACPVCLTPTRSAVTALPLHEGVLAEYLRHFYQNRLEPARCSDGQYILRMCGTCSLIYQEQILSPASLDHLYSAIITTDRSSVQLSRGLNVRRQYSHQIEQVVLFFGVPPAELEVLDFGGGWGLWLDMAAGYGCRTTLSDLATNRAASARVGGHRVIPPSELPDEQFHFVNADQVFEHLAEPRTVLAELVRSLRPGGLLRISVPDGERIPALLEHPDWEAPKGSPTSLNPVAPLEHINCFNHQSLLKLATDIGGMQAFTYPLKQQFNRWVRPRFVGSSDFSGV